MGSLDQNVFEQMLAVVTRRDKLRLVSASCSNFVEKVGAVRVWHSDLLPQLRSRWAHTDLGKDKLEKGL